MHDVRETDGEKRRKSMDLELNWFCIYIYSVPSWTSGSFLHFVLELNAFAFAFEGRRKEALYNILRRRRAYDRAQ